MATRRMNEQTEMESIPHAGVVPDAKTSHHM